MPWNAADLALASLRVLGQAPPRSQPGAQGSSPLPQPSQVDHIPAAWWESTETKRHRGQPGHPLLVLSRGMELRGGVSQGSWQAPGSQVLTQCERCGMRSAEQNRSLPRQNCSRAHLCTKEEQFLCEHISSVPRWPGWPCR